MSGHHCEVDRFIHDPRGGGGSAFATHGLQFSDADNQYHWFCMLLKRKSAISRGNERYDRPIASDDDKAAARKAAIERTRGMFAHLAPGRSLVDELIADRRAEARAEDLEEAKRRRRGKN